MEKSNGNDTPPPSARSFMRPVASLVLFTLVGTALVAITADLAQERIAANQAQQAIKTLLPLLPEGGYNNQPHLDTIEISAPDFFGTDRPQTIYRVRLNENPVAAILTVTAPDGYIAPIQLLVAIDAGGRIMGVRALQHQETPGLGDKIEVSKHDWIRGFSGRDLNDPVRSAWAVRADAGQFDQITGATITSRTVVSAVRDALIYFAEHKQAIFSAPAQAATDAR